MLMLRNLPGSDASLALALASALTFLSIRTAPAVEGLQRSVMCHQHQTAAPSLILSHFTERKNKHDTVDLQEILDLYMDGAQAATV